jgi:hypothetical protein
MKNTRKPYAMGGATDALSVAPTANYSGPSFIQDMSEAWPGRRGASKKATRYNKRNINCRGNKCYKPNR